jgi:hypothetical protein
MATQPDTLFEPKEEATPFDGDLNAEPASVVARPNPVTSQVLSAAMINDIPTSSKSESQMLLEKARQEAEAAAANGETDRIRADVALSRMARKRQELTINIPKFTDSQVYRSGQQYQTQVATSNFQRQMKTAAEHEAVESIQNLAAAGDTTQARILMNRLKPEKSDLVQVWQDNITKSLMLAQLAEKFKQEDNNEGWLASAYTGLISLLQPSSFSYLGNVDNGVGGFTQRGALARFFTPGKDQQNQAQAIWNMSPEELSDYLPQFEANIRSNAKYLGVSNPDKLVELIGNFQTPLSDTQATERSVLSNVELATMAAPEVGIVPYRLAGKTLSVPFTMVRAGARREAAEAVAAAHESLVREGAEVTAEKTAMSEADVMDNIMPSAINPEKTNPNLNVSLSGEVKDRKSVVSSQELGPEGD